MTHQLSIPAAACLATMSFSLARAACPAATVTVPGDTGGQVALQDFQASVMIGGAADLLERHGYCPVATGPAVVMTASTCSAASCDEDYEATQDFTSAAGDAARETRAHLVFTTSNAGPQGPGKFTVEDLGIAGIGSSPALSDYQAEVLMSGLALAGIPAVTNADQSMTLSASRVMCYHALYQGAPTTCNFTALGKTYPLNDADGTVITHQTLADLGGLFDNGATSGAQQSAAALVTCTRAAPSGSPAICSLIIE